MALAGVLRGLVAKFCADWPRWQRAAEAAANLDALCSLAIAAEELAAACQDVCTPRVLPQPAHGPYAYEPYLRTEGLRHPCVAALTSGATFVPNDTALGGEKDAPFLLLTGPNMGGKSTLLRQAGGLFRTSTQPTLNRRTESANLYEHSP